jgi:hypothetical protein
MGTQIKHVTIMAGGVLQSGADLSRELNPTKYQYLAQYSPQAVHFPG